MKVTRVGQFGWQLTRMGVVNSYVVRERNGCTLLDANLPGSAREILQEVHKQGAGEVERILLTHAHGDHVGSVDELMASLGDVDLAISARAARLLPKKPAQDHSLDPDEPQCKMRGIFPGIDAMPTHLVNDGELFGSLRCIATPGHTPGHFSFFDERDGTLYAGDEIITVGGTARVSGYAPWYFPLPNFATWHRPTALESARTLADLPIQRIASGHGRIVEDASALLQAVREAASKS
jgi:glyoxylase-like metal-dependent hydrolase (beta-lactamase superfamily II)